MVGECEAQAVELPTIVRWVEALAEVQARVVPRFPTAKVRERAVRYLVGLLVRVERELAC
jgi:hypothetical protein